MTDHPTLTIDQAAAALGISREAVRLRLRRGTLAGERRSGQWVVWSHSSRNQPPDRPRPTGDRDALVAQLQAENTRLWAELERRGVELAEMRRLLAMQTPALPAPTRPETHENAPATAAPVLQTASRRRWVFWRR